MIIADTGFWLALADQSDRHHQRAVQFLDTNQERLISTWPVLAETCHLLLSRLGSRSMLSFMDSYRNDAFELFSLQASDRERLLALMHKYQSLPMDLADASLVILAEYLGRGRIVSTDRRDFQTYRWKHHQPFENLLLAG